jgi:hypothetical protein
VGVGHIGVYLEGTATTCYKSSFVAKRKNTNAHLKLS